MEKLSHQDLAHTWVLTSVVSEMQQRGVDLPQYSTGVQLGRGEHAHTYIRGKTIFITSLLWDYALAHDLLPAQAAEVMIERALLVLVASSREERGLIEGLDRERRAIIACGVQSRSEYIASKRGRFTEDTILWMNVSTHTEQEKLKHTVFGQDNIINPQAIVSFQERRTYLLDQESHMPEYLRALGLT